MTGKTPQRSTIRSVLQKGTLLLQQKALHAQDKRFARSEAEILLSYAAAKDRSWLIAHDDQILPPRTERTFNAFIRRRALHEPVAYIVGEREFYGRCFHVTRNTLIPRPETEMLIDLAKASCSASNTNSPLIWDVGTGSGAIAITIGKEMPHAHIIASDSSPAALRVAKRNAALHNIASNIQCIQGHLLTKKLSRIFQNETTTTTFIIIANLPYLPEHDKNVLAPDVVRFEPSKALFAGKDGLQLIKTLLEHIASASTLWPFSTIHLFFEFDPPQAQKLKKLAAGLFPSADISIYKDFAKRNRVLSIRFTPSPGSVPPASRACR